MKQPWQPSELTACGWRFLCTEQGVLFCVFVFSLRGRLLNLCTTGTEYFRLYTVGYLPRRVPATPANRGGFDDMEARQQ